MKKYFEVRNNVNSFKLKWVGVVLYFWEIFGFCVFKLLF